MSIPTGLPPGWQVSISRSRHIPFYYNEATKQSFWEPPPGTDLEQLKRYNKQPKEVRVNHLLIKHNKSRRPSSWKSENITRTKEEATEILLQHLHAINSGDATLSELALTESDCSSHVSGGDLGFFGRGKMQPRFEEVAFKLRVGQVSGVVDTDSGVHLIERTG